MTARFISRVPGDLAPGALYDLLVAAVQPRPIGFISTLSEEGVANLAPFSFFMVGGIQPPSLMYCPTGGSKGKDKDSLRNADLTGEFVVNVVVRDVVPGMNEAGYDYPSDVSEWPATGLTPLPSDLVRPARVAESPVQMECRTFQIIRHGAGPFATNYVIGEIVRIHVREDLLVDGVIQAERLRPVGRLGGADYIDLANQEIFTLPRPKPPVPPSSS